MLHGLEMYLDEGLSPLNSWALILNVFLVVLILFVLLPQSWGIWRAKRRRKKEEVARWRIRL